MALRKPKIPRWGRSHNFFSKSQELAGEFSEKAGKDEREAHRRSFMRTSGIVAGLSSRWAKPKAQGAHDLENGGEPGVSFGRERLVEALPAQAGLGGDLRHPPGPRGIPQRRRENKDRSSSICFVPNRKITRRKVLSQLFSRNYGSWIWLDVPGTGRVLRMNFTRDTRQNA